MGTCLEIIHILQLPSRCEIFIGFRVFHDIHVSYSIFGLVHLMPISRLLKTILVGVIFCSNELFSSVPYRREFMSATNSATRTRRFTVDLPRCNHQLYSNSLLFQLYKFLSSTILKHLNETPIAICVPDPCSISMPFLCSPHFLTFIFCNPLSILN